MSEVTRLLDAAAAGDPRAAADLLPLVYDELRALAAARMARETPGHTLDATALVHEAYLRLVGGSSRPALAEHPCSAPQAGRHFDGRGHFFAAAAEAMRRILIEAARRKGRVRHGAGRRKVELTDLPASTPPEELLALDEALDRLAERDPVKAEVVKLRFFAGLTVPQVAAALGISVATAERHWSFARTWLFTELNDSQENPSSG